MKKILKYVILDIIQNKVVLILYIFTASDFPEHL